MRLCFFGLYLTHRGGVENISVNLVKHLAQNRNVEEILIVCDGVDEEAGSFLKNEKINLQVSGRPKRSDLLRIMIRNIKYRRLPYELSGFDILHVLDSRASPFIVVNGPAFVITIHDAMSYEFLRESKAIGMLGVKRLPRLIDHYWPQMLLELISVGKTGAIIVNSTVIADRLRRLYGSIAAGKIKIIPPGFDPTKYNPHFINRSDAKRFLKLGSSSRVLLHVGGCKERKGLPYLLNALRFMQKTGELDRLGIVLLVLGKVGERYAEIFPSLRKHLVELPYVTEEVLPIVFRAADLLVMPSTSEGWGIALIQALACGTPVVASQHVPSAFATKGLGVVNIEYETNSPRRLAESILTVLNGESLETRNWDHIFGSLVLDYSWEKVANSHFEAYNELVYENSKRILA